MNLRKAEHVSIGQEQEGDRKKCHKKKVYNTKEADQVDTLQKEILKFHALIKVPDLRDPKHERVHCMICTSNIRYCKCVDRPSSGITDLNMNDLSSCQTCKKSLNKGQKTCLDDKACRIVENRPRKNLQNLNWRRVDEWSKQHLSNFNQTEINQNSSTQQTSSMPKTKRRTFKSFLTMHALFEPPSAPFHKAPSQIYPKISQGPRSGPWICFRNIPNKRWEEKGKKEEKRKKGKKKGDGEPLKRTPGLSATHANERAKRAREPLCSEVASVASEPGLVEDWSPLIFHRLKFLCLLKRFGRFLTTWRSLARAPLTPPAPFSTFFLEMGGGHFPGGLPQTPHFGFTKPSLTFWTQCTKQQLDTRWKMFQGQP